jgi:hypothetical protein
MSHSHDAPSTRDFASPTREDDREAAEAERTGPEHHGGEPDADAVGPTPGTERDDHVEREGDGLRSGTLDDESTTGDAGTAGVAHDEHGEQDERATDHDADRTRAGGDGDDGGALLPADVDKDFQGRWDGVQARFVDDPRSAVEEADTLVASLMQELANGFARERDTLESQWSRGDDVSTEDMRIVLQRYRSFFRRLLSA